MFANLLAWDDSTCGEMQEALLEKAQIKNRIRALDGHSRTLVTLYGKDGHLAVGGDYANGLVVYATLNNREFYQLISRCRVTDVEVTVIAGGQPGRYLQQYVVQAEEAIRAAEAFAEDGRLADGAEWVRQ